MTKPAKSPADEPARVGLPPSARTEYFFVMSGFALIVAIGIVISSLLS